MPSESAFLLDSPSAWKSAMQSRLRSDGISRYQFVRMCAERGICTRHTAECLMADEGTVTGARKPSMETAIAMARLAGFDVTMVPRPAARRRA